MGDVNNQRINLANLSIRLSAESSVRAMLDTCSVPVVVICRTVDTVFSDPRLDLLFHNYLIFSAQ